VRRKRADGEKEGVAGKEWRHHQPRFAENHHEKEHVEPRPHIPREARSGTC
jgi:hypothetical protein